MYEQKTGLHGNKFASFECFRNVFNTPLDTPLGNFPYTFSKPLKAGRLARIKT